MSTILLIRHAEKPDRTMRGVRPNGTPDPESLTVRGWERAGALAQLLGAEGGLRAPARTYASAPGKQKLASKKVGSDSERPLLTISALAAKLRLKPIEKFTKGEESDLVKALVQHRGVTLVCWQHEAIPAIARLILGKEADQIPDPWPADRFDVVWRFKRRKRAWTFKQLCQRLLPGDKAQPIG
jgi:broad specificity phosphatase PhoE